MESVEDLKAQISKLQTTMEVQQQQLNEMSVEMKELRRLFEMYIDDGK